MDKPCFLMARNKNLLLSTTMKLACLCLLISPIPPSRKPTQVSWNQILRFRVIIAWHLRDFCFIFKHRRRLQMLINWVLTSSPMTPNNFPLVTSMAMFAVFINFYCKMGINVKCHKGSSGLVTWLESWIKSCKDFLWRSVGTTVLKMASCQYRRYSR